MNRLLVVLSALCLAFAAAAQTNPIAGSWTLVFDDEFTGTTLNTNLWNPSGFVDNLGLELETYYATNVVVTNGLLQLWAYNPSSGVYTSGKVTTMDKFWQRYGYFEASVNVPRAVNLWPAFWNLKEPYNTNDVTEPDWPPEVDILEVNPTGGGAQTYYSANIARGPNYPLCGGQGSYWDYVTGSVSDLTTGFHTIGYLWTSAGHSFYVDGTLIGSSTAHPFTVYPTWFMLQNAIKPSPSGLPAAFQIDYVRFWAANGMLPPIITSQPTTQTVVTNTAATFTVTCTNALTYQWTMAGTNVTGATSSTWTYTPSAVQTQRVSVVVTNAYGGRQSGFVQLQAQSQSGPLAQIGVTPGIARVAPGGQQQFSATGTNLLGDPLVPQPAFGWSLSGGGTIDGTGLFTAGSVTGGPFGVTAASGGITGVASVSVVTASGATIGNTKEGTSTDTMWNNGALINLARFQAGSNMVVSTMFAEVGAISGGYKCAIYTDKSGSASALLGGTAEVRTPTKGWNVFPLISSIALTNGQYYWLAIWSSDANATVYYSDASGTLRWGQYNYGAWPDPITTTGGSPLDYCIYAVGAAGPAPTLMSMAVTPANRTVLTGTSQPFTAMGTYSDGSTQNLTSQVTWTSSKTTVATIGASGLATAAAAGSTTISAALGGVSNGTTLTVMPSLTGITVTPANPTVVAGGAQAFTATGTYSDGSTQNLTSQVTWTSSKTTVATINASGLATAVASGSTTISATLAALTGSTLLTVPTPLAITTTSLPSGVTNMAYSATLAASGGTTPYTWSIASGSLPPGLTLNATSGAISGTPTATGAFSFSVQVNDASLPMQTATNALSINIASVQAAVSIWPVTAMPVTVDGGSSRATELGVKFSSDVAGAITGIRFYKAPANTGTHIGNLWTITGTQLATATFSAESASGWQQELFGVPVTITSNTVYVASYHVNNGHYSADTGYFSFKGADNPPLHALTDGVSGGNGVHLTGWSSAFPNRSGNAANYWVDVLFNPAAVATLTSIAVTPVSSTNLVGATQQFTATGTYSDGSKQDLTSQAAWTSSNTAIATINASGLATAVSAGSTAISAALAGVTNSATLTVTAPPTLTSIAVMPANPAILVGASQPFTATGIYSDSSTKNITSQATWTSSSTGVATINASGSATGVSAGGTTISAALAGVSGQTTLTVQAPPTLASIAVTPANPAIMIGATQQFTATGTYSDGSTQNLSSQVRWTSSKTAVAAINANGLATGVSAGATVITAALSGVTATNTLTVLAAPLVLATTSMPTGTVRVAYSATLLATGGTTPYAWSIASGSLSGGVSLNTVSGAITGAPTNAGTFTFTARVSDAGSPQQIASNAFSITISSAPTTVTIWPSSAMPGNADSGPDSAVELGMKFKSDVSGRVTGIRFYKASANTGTHVGNLWSSAGTKLATATFSGETASGWQQVSFATPVAITANTVYVASYHASNGHYSEDDNYFASKGVDNPPLHALASGVSGGDSVYAYGASSAFPNSTWNAANYWVDLVFASP